MNKAILNNKTEIDNPVLKALCDELSSAFVEAYRNNKDVAEDDRNVIRQAFSLIASQNDLERISRLVKYHINTAQLKRSAYKESFDSITDSLDILGIFEAALKQCDYLCSITKNEKTIAVVQRTKLALEILQEGAFETMRRVLSLVKDCPEYDSLVALSEQVALYRVTGEQVLLASNYGVPQNRQRVIFVGCRNDQDVIDHIPFTVDPSEKVTVAEAIGDLDYIGIGDHPYDYDNTFARRFAKTKAGSIKRAVDGKPSADGLTFSEWSKKGRLDPKRFPKLLEQKPVYTPANAIGEVDPTGFKYARLQNHETSRHNDEVQARYALLSQYGGYHESHCS